MKLITLLSVLISFNASSEVLLKDIGIIGLASHDMFTWDRKNEINLENGRLDLSTIFDYEKGKRWKKGGNPKNGENAPVWSITKRLINFYKIELQKNKHKNNKKIVARINTVKEFHAMIKESYIRLSGLDFPAEGLDEKVTNVEQAVFRSLHDILPGRINLYRRYNPMKSIKLTNFLFAKLYLNTNELNQEIKYFNGDYDEEYKNISIPFSKKKINLKEVDKNFIEKFSNYKQDEMLAELKKVGLKEIKISQVYFIHHLRTLFSKGICSTNNLWMPQNIECI